MIGHSGECRWAFDRKTGGSIVQGLVSVWCCFVSTDKDCCLTLYLFIQMYRCTNHTQTAKTYCVQTGDGQASHPGRSSNNPGCFMRQKLKPRRPLAGRVGPSPYVIRRIINKTLRVFQGGSKAEDLTNLCRERGELTGQYSLTSYLLTRFYKRDNVNIGQFLPEKRKMAKLEEATTVQPRYNEPLSNEDPGMTNDVFQPSNGKMYGEEPRCNERR